MTPQIPGEPNGIVVTGELKPPFLLAARCLLRDQVEALDWDPEAPLHILVFTLTVQGILTFRLTDTASQGEEVYMGLPVEEVDMGLPVEEVEMDLPVEEVDMGLPVEEVEMDLPVEEVDMDLPVEEGEMNPQEMDRAHRAPLQIRNRGLPVVEINTPVEKVVLVVVLVVELVGVAIRRQVIITPLRIMSLTPIIRLP